MTSSPVASGERPGGSSRFGTKVLALVVVLLLAVVGWLMSERNGRRWYLVRDGETLSVKKGVMFPVGRQPFKTDDPALAQAYGPLRLPPGARVDDERGFDDRAGLDQALYDLLARWARDDISSGKPELVERALSYLGRADQLAGISGAQREDLRALRAESGWFEARQLLDKGADALRQARERLRLTASSSSSHAGAAAEAVRQLDPLVDELYRVARAVSGASRPGEALPAAPAAAGPPAQPSAAPPASAPIQDGGSR